MFKWILLAAGGLFLFAGLLNTLLVIGAVVCLTVAALGFWKDRQKPEVSSAREANEVLDIAVLVGQEPVALPLALGQPEVGRFFYIHDVLITNRTGSSVSLMPSLVIDLVDGNYAVLDQKGFAVIPENFTATKALLHGPLDIDPGKSVRGDLGFTLMGPEEETPFGDDFDRQVRRLSTGAPVMYVVLRDLVSGREIAQDVTFRKMTSSSGSLADLQERSRSKQSRSRSSETEIADRLVSELKDGHLLDARLQTSKRRDKAWYDLIDAIDDWTFNVQQLLYNGPTELLTDFDGDWKPFALQSRDKISEGLQARLRELSAIVQELRRRKRA